MAIVQYQRKHSKILATIFLLLPTEGKGDNNLNFSQIGIIRKELLSKIFYILNLLLVQKF